MTDTVSAGDQPSHSRLADSTRVDDSSGSSRSNQRKRDMKRTFALLACCSIASLTIGCSQPVVRGQNQTRSYSYSPQVAGYGDGGMPQQMQMAGPPPGPIYYDGPAMGGMGCPTCPTRPADVWRPTHHHTSTYKAPQNLQYPPQNQKPAVYQYPYYTVKGPTDFFYK